MALRELSGRIQRYLLGSPIAAPHDLEGLINGCVTVLEGDACENLTQKEALRWLVHLVRNIQQPLHVVTVYKTLADHPKREAGVNAVDRDPGDVGGNALDCGSSVLQPLWDKLLVNDVFRRENPQELAEQVMAGIAQDRFKTPGKDTTWATKCATDSMRIASRAYAVLAFGKAPVCPHRELATIQVALQPTLAEHRTKFALVIAEQVRKGGRRLAALLNEIQWNQRP